MWIHLLTQNLIKGASPASGLTLTEADLQAITARVWSYKPDSVYSAEQLMNLFASALGSFVSGMDSKKPAFMALDNSKVRIKYETDKYGNRTKRLILDLN